MANANETITITFGDVAENHAKMQQIGELADEGFTVDELLEAKQFFALNGIEAKVYDLRKTGLGSQNAGVEEAAVLVVRGAIDFILGKGKTTKLKREMKKLEWDTKAKMYGRVVNKHARYNLCFSLEDQEPDLENGKGRVISWHDVPLLAHLRSELPSFLGEKAENLQGEGNYYYDVAKCGIGFHGDGERRKVIAVRLGASMKLHYQWYLKGEPVGKRMILNIHGGDMYVMSQKAVGFDWKKKNMHTLRHAAGAKKFVQ